MQFSNSLIAAAVAFLPLINAHISMVQPVPYAGVDSSPLNADGSNFPCKFPGGVGQKQAPAGIFTPGQSASFDLKGSAVHGGGSCQISITYDNPPTKDSVFKVVQSYEGGCPVSAVANLEENPEGKLPPIPVMLPDGLKAGEAVFVWTWFNHIGNREMYMNCAPITIGGSGSSDDVFNGLPDMFIANIGSNPRSACTTSEGIDIVFPNAGSNVRVVDGGKFGPACPGGPSTPGGSNGGNDTPVPAPTTAAPPSVTTQPILIGGPELSTTEGAAGPSFSEIGAPSSEAPAPTQTTFMTISTTVAAVPTPPAASSTQNAPAPVPTSGSGNDTGNDVIGDCDPSKAVIICHSDPTVYSQCYNNGAEYGPYAVPPGTVCDSTGMGGFKAVVAVSNRFVRRNLARKHRRSFFHSHSQ